MILSGGWLSVNDAFIKALQLDGTHAFEGVYFRNVFALISLLPLYAKLGARASARINNAAPKMIPAAPIRGQRPGNSPNAK